MSNKKKIVIVISIITIFIVILSVSAFANDSDYYGLTIPSGTTLIFKDTISDFSDITNGTNYNLNFTSNNTSNTYIRFTSDGTYNYIYYSSNLMTYVYSYRNSTTHSWRDSAYKSITLTSDYTLENNALSNFLIKNVNTGLPEPPPPPPPPPQIEPSFWETVSGFFSEALTSGTAIVNWMTDTPIALIPLALYCLIVIIAITKRMIKG